MQHFGRADSVHDLDAGGRTPGIEGRLRQSFAGRDALAQQRNVTTVDLGEHCTIRGRRREADGRAILFDGREQVVRRHFFD